MNRLTPEQREGIRHDLVNLQRLAPNPELRRLAQSFEVLLHNYSELCDAYAALEAKTQALTAIFKAKQP